MKLARFASLIPLVLLATTARADPLLETIRSEAARAEVSGFERTTRAENQTDNGPVMTVRIDRFNPRAPRGKQWTLVSVNGRPPTGKEISEHRKRVTSYPVPGFYLLRAILAGEPTRTVDARGRSVYRWEKLPPGSLPTPGPDVSERLAAEATLETVAGRPVFTRVRIYAPQPFPIMAVARMKAFDLMSVYQLGEGGKTVLVAQTSKTDVSAPFGQGERQVSQISFRPI